MERATGTTDLFLHDLGHLPEQRNRLVKRQAVPGLKDGV